MIVQDAQAQAWTQQSGYGIGHQPHNAAVIVPGYPLVWTWTPAPGNPWDDLYVYQKVWGTNSDVSHVVDFTQRFNTGNDKSDCNAWENDYQIVYSGGLWNGGIQALLHDANPRWRGFDFVNQRWVDLGIAVNPTDFVPGVFTHVTVTYKRLANALQFLELCVNGNTHPLAFQPASKPTNESDYISFGWQIDSLGTGLPINGQIGNYNVVTL